VEIVGYTTFDRWRFRFEENRMEITEFSITGELTYSAEAQAD